MRSIIVMAAVAICLALSGCGIAAKVDARQAYEQATQNYNACLAQNPSNVSACAGDQQIMENDEAEYNNFSAGIQLGATQSVTLNQH